MTNEDLAWTPYATTVPGQYVLELSHPFLNVPQVVVQVTSFSSKYLKRCRTFFLIYKH